MLVHWWFDSLPLDIQSYHTSWDSVLFWVYVLGGSKYRTSRGVWMSRVACSFFRFLAHIRIPYIASLFSPTGFLSQTRQTWLLHAVAVYTLGLGYFQMDKSEVTRWRETKTLEKSPKRNKQKMCSWLIYIYQLFIYPCHSKRCTKRILPVDFLMGNGCCKGISTRYLCFFFRINMCWHPYRIHFWGGSVG